MRNFLRAVQLLARCRLPLVLSIVCSLLVAALWGGNIGALYPVIEVSLRGQSIQEWQAKEIEQAKQRLAKLERDIQQRETRLAAQRSKGGSRDSKLLSLKDDKLKEQEFLKARQLFLDRVGFLPDDPFRTVLVLVLFTLGLTIARQLFLVSNLVASAWCVQQATVALQQRYLEHVLRLDMENYERIGVARLVTNFTESLELVSRGLHTLLGASIREPLKILACAVGAAAISWRMLLLTLLVAPLATALVAILARLIRRTVSAHVTDTIYLNKLAFESIGALPIIQAFTMESPMGRQVWLAARERMRRAIKTSFYVALTKPISEVLGLAAIAVALLCGAYLVLNHETHLLGVRMTEQPLSVGAMLVFFGMLVGMNEPARRLSDTFGNLQIACAAADRLFAILDTPPAVCEPVEPTPIERVRGDVRLESVTFGYHQQTPVLRDVSLHIRSGETIALVGENGCGKSTLAKLLLRFYDPQSGCIRMDGVDLREISLNEVRSPIAIVPQKTTLFDDSVANNIRFGSPDADLSRVVAAAKRAHADKFITESLPHGYQTRVGHDGQSLSGGQRQRIALARAILRDPRLLILDEAASQIDPQSELLIRSALEEFIADRTCIIITHRANLMPLADRIVVMEAGAITAVGSYQELTAACPTFQYWLSCQARAA